jgi:hypothetical protein
VDHQFFECVFDGFDVFVGGTLVLEGLNGGIELSNFGIKGLDVLLILYVVENKGIEFLVVGGFLLGREKNGSGGDAHKKCYNGGYHAR